MGVLLEVNNNLNRNCRALISGDNSVNCVNDLATLCAKFPVIKEEAQYYPIESTYGPEAAALIQGIEAPKEILEQSVQMTK